jgi:hypothetical protein
MNVFGGIWKRGISSKGKKSMHVKLSEQRQSRRIKKKPSVFRPGWRSTVFLGREA